MEEQKKNIRKFLESEGLTAEIEVDPAGQNVFDKLYGQHTQKGPDVLRTITPEKSLNFKTTFMPGPNVGSLRCKIAGEQALVVNIEADPKDWSLFAEELNRRNAKIAEKSRHESVIDERLREQRAASEKARLDYEKSGDPEIIINYVRSDPFGENLKEPWITNILAEWHRENRRDLFNKLHSPRGRPRTPYSKVLENLIFVDRIDRYKADQGSLSAAIITEMQRLAGGELSEIDEKTFQKIKNRYEDYKNISTVIRVNERLDHYELTVYAAKATSGTHPIARGTFRYKYPKK